MGTTGAAGFLTAKSNARRASWVLLGGTFVLLLAVANLVTFMLGGYLDHQACVAPGCSAAGWRFNPGSFALTFAVVGTYLAIAYLASARAALALSHARPSGPEHAQVRNLLAGVSIAAGLPEPRLYVVEDPAPNAFAVGLRPEKAAIAVTTGLLERMSRRELEGVLAHEVAHIKNRDMRAATIAVLAVSAITMIADLCLRLAFVLGDEEDSNARLVGLIVAVAVYALAVPVALLLRAGLSRSRESLADATAVELTRNPTGLRSALEKLEADTTVVRAASSTTSHLWIESPLERKGRRGGLGRLLDTHPPLAERIERLRSYEGLDPALRGPVDSQPAG